MSVTYRLYDYGRLDQGKPRELHIDKSIDVIRCPHMDKEVRGKATKTDAYELEELIRHSLTLLTMLSHGGANFTQDFDFLNISVINGSGKIDGTDIKKGDHFILVQALRTFGR